MARRVGHIRHELQIVSLAGPGSRGQRVGGGILMTGDAGAAGTGTQAPGKRIARDSVIKVVVRCFTPLSYGLSVTASDHLALAGVGLINLLEATAYRFNRYRPVASTGTSPNSIVCDFVADLLARHPPIPDVLGWLVVRHRVLADVDRDRVEPAVERVRTPHRVVLADRTGTIAADVERVSENL